MSNIANNDVIIVCDHMKNILDGCDTIIDALLIKDKYRNKYPDLKSIIHGYISSKEYPDGIDIRTKQIILRDTLKCDNSEDAAALLESSACKTNDAIYKAAMDRIIGSKPHKIVDKKIQTKNYNVIATKRCPHCKHTVTLPSNTEYVVCGYHDTVHGYDWVGCGRDWCFKCGKKLCKKWDIDDLYLQMNRRHTDVCCSKHANKGGYNYPTDYCQCINMYVQRDSCIFN